MGLEEGREKKTGESAGGKINEMREWSKKRVREKEESVIGSEKGKEEGYKE